MATNLNTMSRLKKAHAYNTKFVLYKVNFLLIRAAPPREIFLQV